MVLYAPYRDPDRVLTVPNALSIIALLCGLGVLWRAGFENDVRGGLWFMFVGGALCVLDGMTADWFDQHTELGDKQLQPIAGLVIGVSAVVSLVWHDHWSVWLAVVLAAVMVALQFISFFASRMPRLKRHQFWLHPIFTVVVTYAALVTFALLSLKDSGDRPVVWWVAVVAAVGLVALRWRRYREWFAGPDGQ